MSTAILIDCWEIADPRLQRLDVAPALLPLGDRPMLQRVVERLVRLGATDIHVLLGEHSESVRALLGDGSRWGCRVRYHYAQAGISLARALKTVCAQPDAFYWLASSDTLPLGCHPAVSTCLPAMAMGSAAFWKDDATQHWSGWGRFHQAWLTAMEAPMVREDIEARILADSRIERRYTEPPLRDSSIQGLLAAGLHVLTESDPDAGIASPASQQGVWIRRGARIHEGARLIPPVYIGEQVSIGAGATVGPHAVIGAGCIIDRHATVQHSLVAPDTYLGEWVELHRAIAAGARLANVDLDTVMAVEDTGLIAPLQAVERPRIRALLIRMAWFALAPLYGLGRLIQDRQEALPEARVTLPRPSAPAGYTEVAVNLSLSHEGIHAGRVGAWLGHFVHGFYPGLKEVARGRLSLHGPQPRSRPEVDALPHNWRELYAQSRCGLINEGLFLGREGASLDMRFAADLSACRNRSRGHAMKLLARYLGMVLVDGLQVLRQHLSAPAPTPDHPMPHDGRP